MKMYVIKAFVVANNATLSFGAFFKYEAARDALAGRMTQTLSSDEVDVRDYYHVEHEGGKFCFRACDLVAYVCEEVNVDTTKGVLLQ